MGAGVSYEQGTPVINQLVVRHQVLHGVDATDLRASLEASLDAVSQRSQLLGKVNFPQQSTFLTSLEAVSKPTLDRKP